MFETRGIATAVLGLVRLHMEKSPPPRGLWTTFQLGRPVGEPGDADFQRRVLVHALGLLERADGPRILEDYPQGAPNWQPTPGWRPPFDLPAPVAGQAPHGWGAALSAEIEALKPYWEQARARSGRSTVGVSLRPPEAWPGVIAEVLAGGLPESPAAQIPTPVLALRFLVDDLKAYYGEAAQSAGAPPSSRQLDAWFWGQTVAGAVLQQVRVTAMSSDINALKVVGGRFFVPAPYVVAQA